MIIVCWILFAILVTMSASSLPPTTQTKAKKVEQFGTVLGITDGGVEVYSCDYPSINKTKYPNRESLQMVHNGVYTGFAFQCVELARRFFVANYGVVFESIPMAYDIFDLRTVKRVSDGELLHFRPTANGESTSLPVKGDLLIWEPMGEFTGTGHVAVVVNSGSGFVDIVEQNVEDALWEPGTNYSRRLRVVTDSAGKHEIHCDYGKGGNKVLGWMRVDFETPYVHEELKTCKASDLKQVVFKVDSCLATKPWLDKNDQAVKAFVSAYGENLFDVGGNSVSFYTLPETAHHGLAQATRELHRMFMHATEHVLHNDELLGKKFLIPEKMWQRLRTSWYRTHKGIVAGRFDFTLSESGVKCYEYNADSASCLMECGHNQGAWSNAVGIGHIGRNSSDELFNRLVETWKAHKVTGTLHIMYDQGAEEFYHAMYMKNAAEKAGIACKAVLGVDSLSFASTGEILDESGEIIRTVWKTWSWQTALNQLKESDLMTVLAETENGSPKKRDPKVKPRLIDVLLHDQIRVFEPLWTIIPACKAILPVLCDLYPDSPYLIKSSFDLTPDLLKSGYVSKPVTGRGGKNVKLFDADGKVIEETSGAWGEDKDIYQEFCPLPWCGEQFVQVCTWAVRGEYCGTVLRCDKSKIIGYESGVSALRIIPDQ